MPAGTLLEIGIGNGKHLHHYKTHQITGIDTSSRMLKIAGKQKRKNMELLQMNGEALFFPDQSFDYIILSHVISVAGNPEKLLEETHRVLKRDGEIFILNHFTPNNWMRHVDRSFQPLSKLFHFRSFFRINSLSAISKFRLQKEVSFGRLSYFKLLIYGKL